MKKQIILYLLVPFFACFIFTNKIYAADYENGYQLIYYNQMIDPSCPALDVNGITLEYDEGEAFSDSIVLLKDGQIVNLDTVDDWFLEGDGIYLTTYEDGSFSITAEEAGDFGLNIVIGEDLMYLPIEVVQAQVLRVNLQYYFLDEWCDMESLDDFTLMTKWRLVPYFAGEKISAKKVKWSTSNPKRAKVKKGKLYFGKPGKVTITAKYNGTEDSWVLDIPKQKYKLDNLSKSLTIKKNQVYSFGIIYYENDKKMGYLSSDDWADHIKVTSSNKNIADVYVDDESDYGFCIKGKQPGKTKITIKYGNGKKSVIQLTVTKSTLQKIAESVKKKAESVGDKIKKFFHL